MPKLLSSNHPSGVLCWGGSNGKESEQKFIQTNVQRATQGSMLLGKRRPTFPPDTWCRTRQNGRSFSLGRTSKQHSGIFQFKCFQSKCFFIPTGCFSAWHPRFCKTGIASLTSPGHGDPSSARFAYLSTSQAFSTFQPKEVRNWW